MDEPTDLTSEQGQATGGHAPPIELDLDAVERDLEGVERALARLEAGTYWQCESTGAPIPDELLAADPLTTRLPAPGTT